MNLSLKRKLGALHVRAGNLLSVAHEHQVPTNTQSIGGEDAKFTRTFAADEKWVTTKLGDLALEIVAVKTGNVIGYSYLSGTAIRLHLYRDKAPAHWFTPARAVRATTTSLPALAANGSAIVSGMMGLKYGRATGGAQLVVLELEVDNRESIHEAMRMFSGSYRYIPTDMTEEEAKTDLTSAHLIGAVHLHKSKGPVGFMHFQPPRDASPWSISAFQSLLAIGGEWEVVDPWGDAALRSAG